VLPQGQRHDNSLESSNPLPSLATGLGEHPGWLLIGGTLSTAILAQCDSLYGGRISNPPPDHKPQRWRKASNDNLTINQVKNDFLVQ
jgi:hypothetical protein